MRGHMTSGRMRATACSGCILSVALACAPAFGDPDKVAYELQERCGLRAAQWFKSEFGNGVENTKEGQAVTSFRNHYSSKFNKCIVLTIRTGYNYKQKPKGTSTMEILIDFNENNELGSFYQSDQFVNCTLGDKSCASHAQWQELIKLYLEG
jgi:hypothetical protein